MVLLDRSDYTSEVKDLLERESRQEMERLLYVALTRARHTLVLAFDNELFAKKGGEIHSHSQSKWLKADKGEPNETALANAEIEPAPCGFTADYYKTRRKGTGQIDQKLPVEKISKAAAIGNASIFVRKLNPSGLPADEIEERWTRDESLDLPRPAGAALRYGLWWHDFIQRLNWGNGSENWDKRFDEHRKLSPDPARSSREWKLLLSHLSGSDNFGRDFSGNGSIIQSELPFLWKIDGPSRTGGRCLEGIVDLALFQSAAKKCLILDWKTDRVPPDSPEILRARYRPQLAAYWKAVSEMTKMDVAAAIYSTAAGELVRYETDELEREWQRLEKLPPDDLNSNIKPDPDLPRSNPPTRKQQGRPTQLEFPEL